MRWWRFGLGGVALVAGWGLPACGDSSTPPDAAGDVAPIDSGSDAGVEPAPDAAACSEATPLHSFFPAPLRLVAGSTASVRLRLRRDRGECAADYALETDTPSVIVLPSSVHVDRAHGYVDFTVGAGSAGRARVRAHQTDPSDPTAAATAELDVEVGSDALPACAATTAAATGRLTAGMRVSGAAETPLAAASVGLPSAAHDLDGRAVTLRCAADQIPEGYLALGPAVAFGPSGARFARELPLRVPVNPMRIPPGYELRSEVAYTGPGVIAPRIVPLPNIRLSPDGASLEFLGRRLGTYQAVLRRDTGAARSTRRLTFHAILGISMGGVGSAMLATRHPELFDTMVPLGGPADSHFSGYALREWVFGGFCTEAQRATLGAACDTALTSRTPASSDLGVVPQDFEHFSVAPGGGTGGTFDRRARFQGFRDIARMFGNPIMNPGPTGVLPAGVPDGEIARTDVDRCAHPVVIGGTATGPRFYDDEFDPDGSYPVITFCDGNRATGDPGLWAGGQGTYPAEVALAVDRNRNGVRDWGEPVIRNTSEPFDDVGADGIDSAHETGWDADTNPDPAGDDYDRQYNPAGQEGNFVHDAGEPYRDLGLDGVACPDSTCPFDYGEGNHRFDTASLDRDYDSVNPRAIVANMDPAVAHRLGMWVDGGVRDVLQFGVNANHFAGAIAQRGESLHFFNGFLSLVTGDEVPETSDVGYDPFSVEYRRLPSHMMVHYGFVDASPMQIADGDGAHVGTTDQILNRLVTSILWAQQRWPDLDRTIVPQHLTTDDAGHCANGYLCSFDFHADHANRTGPVSVALPPGYHDPANASMRYPVMFLLHGYGMEPQGLLASALVVGAYMSSHDLADWQRPGKFIMVFPDGRCREGDGCLEGTFYANSPVGNAQMETYFLDLYDFITRTYRVREAVDAEVVE